MEYGMMKDGITRRKISAKEREKDIEYGRKTGEQGAAKHQ